MNSLEDRDRQRSFRIARVLVERYQGREVFLRRRRKDLQTRATIQIVISVLEATVLQILRPSQSATRYPHACSTPTILGLGRSPGRRPTTRRRPHRHCRGQIAPLRGPGIILDRDLLRRNQLGAGTILLPLQDHQDGHHLHVRNAACGLR